jgi:hypothetical protein
MDCSQLVLSVIKDPTVKSNLNPIIYYSIKVIYDPEFSKRSRIFCESLKMFYIKFAKEFKLDSLTSSISPDQKIDNNYIINTLLPKALTLNQNEKGENGLSNLFKNDWDWYIDTLLNLDNTYILDREDDYSLLYLLRDYVFSTQEPTTSELMTGYNLFVSSVELMFCLRKVLRIVPLHLSILEKQMAETFWKSVKQRVEKFFYFWIREYPEKYKNNLFVQNLIKNYTTTKVSQTKQIDLIALSLDEPILTPKYVGLVNLIKEGPFLYDLDEIAKQLCLIDHNNFSSIPQKDYIDFIVKKEIPESFNKIYKREKHFKCYILIFLMLIRNLENQKTAVQNFILLAYKCKKLNNYQSTYTIISTFNAACIQRKEFLWRVLDKKIKELYLIMENEYLDVDLNEKTFFDTVRSAKQTFIPHIDLVRNQINNLIIQIKMSNEEQKVVLCREYRNFYMKVINYSRNKYSFFLINPLNYFLASGFWEICKTKQWGIKAKFDFSLYADEDSDAEKLFDSLVKLYKNRESQMI